MVWDVAHKRATVLDPAGKIARTATMSGALRFPLLAGVFADGDLLLVDRMLDFTSGASGQTELGQDLRYDAAGPLRMPVRWVDGPLDVADADKQAYVDAMAAAAPTEEAEEAPAGLLPTRPSSAPPPAPARSARYRRRAGA